MVPASALFLQFSDPRKSKPGEWRLLGAGTIAPPSFVAGGVVW